MPMTYEALSQKMSSKVDISQAISAVNRRIVAHGCHFRRAAIALEMIFRN